MTQYPRAFELHVVSLSEAAYYHHGRHDVPPNVRCDPRSTRFRLAPLKAEVVVVVVLFLVFWEIRCASKERTLVKTTVMNFP